PDNSPRTAAGNLASLGGGARELKPHAAMDHLRIGKDVIKIVDRSGRNADRFELAQKLAALHALRERREMADQLVTVRQTSDVVEVLGLLRQLRLAQHATQLL